MIPSTTTFVPAFTTAFQSPFESKPTQLGALSAAEVMQEFKAIDWLKIRGQILATEEDDIKKYFYYFEVKYTDNQKAQNTLSIFGEYPQQEYYDQKTPLVFAIRLFRPKAQNITSIQKMLRTTEMEKCKLDFAEKCLLAFINNDTDFLDNEVINNVKNDK